MPLRCRSIDPGPTRSAVAYVEYADGRFRLLEGGWRTLDVLHSAADLAWLKQKLETTRRESGLYAVECIVGYAYEASRVQQLVETARVEGELLLLGATHGLQPVEIPAGDGRVRDARAPLPKLPRRGKGKPARPRRRAAEQLLRGWRGELCHTPWASDAQIRIVVEAMVQGDGVRRTREEEEHLYDAIGVSIVALCRHLHLAIQLPAAVETALWRQQQAEATERARRRELGLPRPKKSRALTRAQRARRAAAQRAGAAR
jgi:hypothetical protein